VTAHTLDTPCQACAQQLEPRFRRPDTTCPRSWRRNFARCQIVALGLRLSHSGQLCEHRAGKSTLLKLMTGELQATEGEVKRHSHLSIAKYHQHSVDALDNHVSCLEFFQVCSAALVSPCFPDLSSVVASSRWHHGVVREAWRGIRGALLCAQPHAVQGLCLCC